MADVKISALPASGALAAGDLFAVVNGGVTSKCTLTQIQTGLTGAFVLKAGDVMTGGLAIGTGSIALTQLGILRLATDTTALGLAYMEQASADADPFDLIFRKARGTTSAPTVITTGDCCGIIDFTGYSGAAGYVTNATIRGDSTGTVANTRVPGRIVFSTGTDAAPSVLTDAMSIDTNQHVGIGLLAPSANFHVSLDGLTPDSTLVSAADNILLTKSVGGSNLKIATTRSGGGTASATVVGVNTRGTLTVPTASVSGDVLLTLLGQGYDGAARQSAASIVFFSNGTPAAGFVPGGITFNTATTAVANSEKMRLTTDGFLGLGVTTVSGLIHAATSTTALGLTIFEQCTADTDDYDLSLRKSRGSIASRLAVVVGDGLGILNFSGYSGAGGYVTSASIRAVSTGTIASTRVAASLIFATGTDAAPTVLTDRWTIDNTGTLIAADTSNIAFNTGTGTKIGTATNQKLAFWNKAPIIQPTNAIAAAAFVANTSLIANDSATFGGYTIGQIAAALIATGILT